MTEKRTSKNCESYEARKPRTLNYLFWILMGTILLVVLNYALYWFGIGGVIVSGILSVIMFLAELFGFILIVIWKLQSKGCEKVPLA